MKLKLKIYLASIYILFVTILVISWYRIDYNQIFTMIGLFLLAYIFNIDAVKDLQSKMSYLIIIPFIAPSIVYLDSFYSVLFITVTLLIINNRQIWYKNLFNATTYGIGIFLTSSIFHHFYPVVNKSVDILSPSFFITLAAVIFLDSVISYFFVFSVISLDKGKIDINAFIGILSATKAAQLTIFLGLINVVLFHYTNLIGVAIFTFMVYFIKPALQYRQIFDNELSTYTNFVLHVLKKMDPITHTHSERVKFWTVLLAEKMELPKSEIRQLSQAASWHDIGKIEIPIDIINKPNKLTSLEYDIMKSHPEKGYQLVKDMHFFKKFLPVIRHHHERVDGKGYPLGLSGKDIPLHARIMAITDAFDAMTSDRSYRKGMSLKEAVSELTKHAGTQFDSAIVESFVKALQEQYGENYERYTKEILKNVI